MGNLFNKIIKSLGKELSTFNSNTIDIITNEPVEIKVVKYERGQVNFYYREKYTQYVEIVIVATPVSYTRAFQIRYNYYPNTKKISNLSILDPEGSIPVLLNE